MYLFTIQSRRRCLAKTLFLLSFCFSLSVINLLLDSRFRLFKNADVMKTSTFNRTTVTQSSIYLKNEIKSKANISVQFYSETFKAVKVSVLRNVANTVDIGNNFKYSKNKSFVSSLSINTIKKGNKLKMKYILLWTNPNDSPFIYLGKGQSAFKDKKCAWTNCFVTGDRNYLGDYTEFDVILFNGPRLVTIARFGDLPERRLTRQKYVYANIESAASYPICINNWNSYFNWTWTYKLNSDAVWGYMVIRNASNHVIGPSAHINWINLYDMDPIDSDLKIKLKTKTKAAAWFVSNCNTLSLREEFVKQIQFHLEKYHLGVDIFGSCGDFTCPTNLMEKCLKLLENNYYFYFAFENAFSEDYVTEKLIYPLKHNTVPVVFGGANYSRFMPNGIYLDARELGPERLANKMYEIIQNPAAYYNFFRWKKYYSYHYKNEVPGTDDYCHFCEIINDEKLMSKKSVHKYFDTWWSGNGTCL